MQPSAEMYAKISDSARSYCSNELEWVSTGDGMVAMNPQGRQHSTLLVGFESQNEAVDAICRAYQFRIESGSDVEVICRSKDGIHCVVKPPFIANRKLVQKIFQYHFGPNSEAVFKT